MPVSNWGFYRPIESTINLQVDIQNPMSDEVFSIVAHELVHWWQDISTPFGLYNKELMGSAALAARNVIGSLKSQSDSTIKLPLYDNYRSESSYIIELELQKISMILVNIYLGNKVVTVKEALSLQKNQFKAFGVDSAYTDSLFEKLIDNSNLEEYSSPIIAPNTSLGVVDIYEGQARAVEEMFLLLKAMKHGHRTWDGLSSDKWFNEYRFALDTYIYLTLWDVDRTSSIEEAFSNLYIFSLICEISLFTPLASRFNKLIKEDFGWQDLHPGWRFYRICQLLGESGSPEIIVGDISSSLKFRDFIYKQFNWPTPNEFYSDNGSMQLRYPEQLLNYSLDLRKKHPFTLVNPFWPIQKEGFFEKLPIPFTSINKEKSMSHIDPGLTITLDSGKGSESIKYTQFCEHALFGFHYLCVYLTAFDGRAWSDSALSNNEIDLMLKYHSSINIERFAWT